MAKPKHDARAETDSAQATAAVAAPAGGEPVAPAMDSSSGEKAGEGNEVAAAAPTSPSPAAPPFFVAAAKAHAAAFAIAATPVVRVTAVRDRWRAKRFWPKGDTDLTAAEAEQLGQPGFDQLRDDPVFTITPLQAD